MRRGVIGEIACFGGNFAPLNWMVCDGQVLPAAQYDTLFHAIGQQYGGDGQTTFALPKIAGPGPGVLPIICADGIFPFDDSPIGFDNSAGEIRQLAAPPIPRGWVPCDGRSLDASQNVALNTILESRFGGDGQGVRVPHLTASVAGLHYVIATSGDLPNYDPNNPSVPSDQSVGEIRLWPGAKIPAGSLPCDGRGLAVADNTALFSILGVTFGGDWRTNFNIPKLSGPIPGTQYLVSTWGVFPSRP